ncbi:MAG: hypothetical protein GC154_04565 [bacterium]|nr:hypothetical protein [bacterium]
MKFWIPSLIMMTSLCAMAQEPVLPFTIDHDAKSASFQAPMFQVGISFQNDPNLSGFSFESQQFLLNPPDKTWTGERGSSLKLYRQHPLQSRDEIALPKTWASDVKLQDGLTYTLTLQSQDAESPIQVTRTYSNKASNLIVNLTTTITNRSNEPLDFYPTEEIAFNGEISDSGKINTLLRIDAPISRDTQTVEDLKFTYGPLEAPQYVVSPTREIFELQYAGRRGELALTRAGNWLAAQSIRNTVKMTGPVCGIEFRYLKPIENTKDNIIFLINGAKTEQDEEHPGSRFDETNSVLVSYIHGKVHLEPGESFEYLQIWNSGVTVGPITRVQDGIAFFKPLEIFLGEVNSFIGLGISTTPVEGKTALQCIDATGEVFRTDPIPVMDPNVPGRSASVVKYDYPLLLSSRVHYGIPAPATPELSDASKSIFAVNVPPMTKSVRFVITDPSNLNDVRSVIAEDPSPWETYESAFNKQ